MVKKKEMRFFNVGGYGALRTPVSKMSFLELFFLSILGSRLVIFLLTSLSMCDLIIEFHTENLRIEFYAEKINDNFLEILIRLQTNFNMCFS